MTPTLTTVEIVVTDMTRSLAFYRRLGFDLPDSADVEPHVEVTLVGGMKVAFDTVETITSFDPDWSAPSGGHRTALAFRCADPAEVDTVFADLTGHGGHGHLDPWDAFWGMRYAVVHDPDGAAVDLFAEL